MDDTFTGETGGAYDKHERLEGVAGHGGYE